MNFIDNPRKLRGFEKNIKVEKISRRSILKGLGITGGFVLAAPVMSRQAFAYETGAGKMPHGVVVDPRVFVAVAPDGTVTILAHRAEMGTGVRTSLPLIVAEEMEADWSRVKVQQAHGDEVKFGNQDTDGSRSTRHYLIPMRQIGASARTMLEQAAAKRWGVPATEVKAVNHEVVHSASEPQARLRRARSRRRQGIGAEHRRSQAEGPQGLPLSRQGPDRHRRSPRHHHRQGALRRRRAAAWHEVCRDRAPAGHRRQAGLVRSGRGDEGPRRREGDGGARLAVAVEIPAARRRRRDRAQHRRGDQGPRRAEARPGTTAPTANTTPSPTARSSRRPRASRASSCARKATPMLP